MEVIKCADWIIDLGPEGGKNGGNIVFEGKPEDLPKIKNSYTDYDPVCHLVYYINSNK
jgi:excinuclease ABC subunit A